MAQAAGSVQDLWHKRDEATKKKIRSDRYGKGMQWRARWTYTDSTGRRTETKSFRTQKEAREFLAAEIARLNAGGKPIANKSETISQAIEGFLAAKEASGKQTTTLDLWKTVLEVHVAPRLGNVRCSELTSAQVAELYVELTKHGKANGKCRTAGITCPAHGCAPEKHAGLGAAIVRHVHTQLRAVLKWSLGGAMALPTDEERARAALPKQGPTRVDKSEYWTHEQAQAFLVHCREDEDPFLPIWTLALATGMRRGELVGLHRDDLALEGPAPHLWMRSSATVVRGKATLKVGGKSEAAVRKVPLGSEVVRVLKEHLVAQESARKDADDWEEHGLLFCDERGRLLDPTRLTRAFTRSSRAAGLPDLGLHGARHYAATSMLRAGVPVATVSRILGHSKPSVTLDIYTHAIPSDDHLAAAAMDAALGQVDEAA